MEGEEREMRGREDRRTRRKEIKARGEGRDGEREESM